MKAPNAPTSILAECDIKSLIEADINNIWEEFKDKDATKEFCEVAPHSIGEIKTGGILFIGLNPSLKDEDKKRLIEKVDKNLTFYQLKNDRKKENSYFKKFYDIGGFVSLEWCHLDLLYIQETNQSKIKKLCYPKDKKYESGHTFIDKQLKVTKKLLKEANPKIIVVCNAFAGELMGLNAKEEDGTEKVWDDSIGTFRYNQIPLFFSGMLTGQRALDRGSYRRLIWHIKFVKDKLKIDAI